MNNNFILKEERDLPEMRGVGRMYAHSSGAQVLHVQNDDENKVFNVQFRTPPYDDSGVPHILEHCVLNGSESYPVKDPFFTMAKGSLQTFINAMTYPDITMYPVASYNDKDFLNLMGVYLDAVYKPLIHVRELTFLQEGWHYVLESPEDELTINGVVYSEMKGAYSEPDSILMAQLNKQLYPQSQYRFESGGAPDAIPSLTYEAFKEFHKTLYSPANSFIYLYGDMEADKCLKLLDIYLCLGEDRRKEIRKLVDVPPQAPLESPAIRTYEYSISDKDDPAGKNHLGAAYGNTEFPDPVTFYGYAALDYILMETPASPLRNALLEKKLGESVRNWYELPLTTPCYVITAKNSAFDVNELKTCVEETIRSIVADGIDKKFVEACLNVLEFKYREKDSWEPKGLTAILEGGCGWAYGFNPMDYFAPVAALRIIREKIASGERYFENLAEKLFIGNNFASFVTLKAKSGLQAKNEETLKKELAAHKETLSEAQIKEIICKKVALDDWQNTPDTPEQLATIPILALSDISKEAKPIPLSERTLGSAKILYADIPTDGIAYNKFMFDIRSLGKEEVPAVGALLILLSKLDTKKRAYTDLVSEVNMQLGGFSSGFSVRPNKDGVQYVPMLEFDVKALDKNAPEIYSLTTEILTGTLFDDKERMRMLLAERKAQIESDFIDDGWSYAELRSIAYLGDKRAYCDLIEGYGFYEYLKAVVDDFDNLFDALRQSLYDVSRKIFSRGALKTALACSDEVCADASGPMSLLHAALSEGHPHVSAGIVPAAINEAFIAESQVSYNVQAFNYLTHGVAYSGLMRVLRGVIHDEYLLQELRVKGGAYGFYGDFFVDGVGVLESYRDPNLERTYNAYKNLPTFIEGFHPSDREMLQFVLGAINKLDQPKSPMQKLEAALHNHFAGITPNDLQKERDELLSATGAKIREFAPLLSKCVASGPICTFGSGSAINENSELFNRIVQL
ncbi:MAG: insulinase family protein [Oscillospiraceae bacterium]|nr:insulinase family protein [Oscillospiraceae bacterium]